MQIVPRRLFVWLVFGVPVLLTTLAVVMGFYALLHLAGDGLGARILLGVGLGLLILLVVNLILVVGALAIEAVERHSDPIDDPTDE